MHHAAGLAAGVGGVRGGCVALVKWGNVDVASATRCTSQATV